MKFWMFVLLLIAAVCGVWPDMASAQDGLRGMTAEEMRYLHNEDAQGNELAPGVADAWLNAHFNRDFYSRERKIVEEREQEKRRQFMQGFMQNASTSVSTPGWQKGPLPEKTYGYGGVVVHGMDGYGFYFADFKGNHVSALMSANKKFEWTDIAAHDVKYYDNSLTLPPRGKETSAVDVGKMRTVKYERVIENFRSPPAGVRMIATTTVSAARLGKQCNGSTCGTRFETARSKVAACGSRACSLLQRVLRR